MSLFLLCEEARPHHGLRFHVCRFIPDTDFLFPPLAVLHPSRSSCGTGCASSPREPVPPPPRCQGNRRFGTAPSLQGQRALRQEPLAHLAQRPTTSLQLRLRWPGWRLFPCFSEHGLASSVSVPYTLPRVHAHPPALGTLFSAPLLSLPCPAGGREKGKAGFSLCTSCFLCRLFPPCYVCQNFSMRCVVGKAASTR